MKHLIDTLATRAKKKDLPVLLIGGHAVTALGSPRSTFDIDLLISRSTAKQWQEELAALHYQVFHENENFLQFESSKDLSLPPIDCMLVSDDVFGQLYKTRVASEPLPTPGVIQIIALKLHALKQPSREGNQDWTDILALIDAHSLSLDNSELNAILLRHGGESAIDKVRDHLGR